MTIAGISLDTIIYVVGGVFSVLFWLLRNKDESQGKQIDGQQRQIDLLFKKHDDDAQALSELRVQIAQRHYERSELDAKFDRIDQTFREGFKDLGVKVDRLSDALTKHITKEREEA